MLALDLGTKRVGVAVSDATATLATPRTTIVRSGDRVVDHRRVAELVVEEEAVLVVVGLPLNMDGSAGPAARAARDEAEALEAVLAVPVEMADERLTTVVADRTLLGQGRRAPARRRVVDQTAAAVLLQSWLDGPGGAQLRAAATRRPEGSLADGSAGKRSASVDG